MTCDLEKYQLLSDKTYYTCLGRVSKVVGLTIESIGPEAKLNDLCKIYRDREQKEYVMAEVVGFKDNRLLLMPFDSIEGLGVGWYRSKYGTSFVCLWEMRFRPYSGWNWTTERCGGDSYR